MPGIRVLDIDDRDRLLVSDEQDATARLLELDARGKATELLTGATTARYLPGERRVVVQHDSPARLSLLRPGGRPTRLLGAVDHATELLGVLPGRVVYRANPRHRLLFDVVIRNVLVGEGQAVYTRGGDVLEAAVSPNSRHVAIRLPRKLMLVDTMPVTEDDHIRLISPQPADGGHRGLHWLPDSTRLVATESGPEGAVLTRYDVANTTWTPLVTDLPAGTRGAVAPNGRRLAALVEGTVRFFDTATGAALRSVAVGPGDGVRWAPGSRWVAVGVDGAVALVTADSGEARTIPVPAG